MISSDDIPTQPFRHGMLYKFGSLSRLIPIRRKKQQTNKSLKRRFSEEKIPLHLLLRSFVTRSLARR
ncbi:hypothetical protein JTE90_009548 [Oedothorax gibbosus]|uniref:Ribosomal protein S18 n=1 Tax=Oedothorax gibbosus TaxID=931172 RepID=A0AAV6UT34_9ARAC|nr:hypothetical protein JTE90_009548 [Oedothorax gibbosus]